MVTAAAGTVTIRGATYTKETPPFNAGQFVFTSVLAGKHDRQHSIDDRFSVFVLDFWPSSYKSIFQKTVLPACSNFPEVVLIVRVVLGREGVEPAERPRPQTAVSCRIGEDDWAGPAEPHAHARKAAGGWLHYDESGLPGRLKALRQATRDPWKKIGDVSNRRACLTLS